MIILRNSLFSKKKKKVKLEDIPSGYAGAGINPLRMIGRDVGIKEANKLDSEGKSDIEIIEGSSKKARKVGKVAGTAAGLAIGIPTGIKTKQFLDEISDQNKLIAKASKPLKRTARLGDAAIVASNAPIIGRRYNIFKKKVGKRYKTGRFLHKVGKASRKVEDVLGGVIESSNKMSKRAKIAAIPAAIGVAGLSTLYGAHRTGKVASRATERNTVDRLGKRHRLEKENK